MNAKTMKKLLKIIFLNTPLSENEQDRIISSIQDNMPVEYFEDEVDVVVETCKCRINNEEVKNG